MRKKSLILGILSISLLAACGGTSSSTSITSSTSTEPSVGTSAPSTSTPSTSVDNSDRYEALANKLTKFSGIFKLEGTVTIEISNSYLPSQSETYSYGIATEHNLNEIHSKFGDEENGYSESYYYKDEDGLAAFYDLGPDNQVIQDALQVQYDSIFNDVFDRVNAYFIENCTYIAADDSSLSLDFSVANKYAEDIATFADSVQLMLTAGYSFGTITGLTFDFSDTGVSKITLKTTRADSGYLLKNTIEFNVTYAEENLTIDYTRPTPLPLSDEQQKLQTILSSMNEGYTAVVIEYEATSNLSQSYMLSVDKDDGVIILSFTTEEDENGETQIKYNAPQGYVVDDEGYIYEVLGADKNGNFVRDDLPATSSTTGEPITMASVAPNWTYLNAAFYEYGEIGNDTDEETTNGFATASQYVPYLMLANSYTSLMNSVTGYPTVYTMDSLFILPDTDITTIEMMQAQSSYYGDMIQYNFLSIGDQSTNQDSLLQMINFDTCIPASEAVVE